MERSEWKDTVSSFHLVVDDPEATEVQVDFVTRGLCHLAHDYNEEHPETRDMTMSELRTCLSKVHARMGDQWFAQHAAVFVCHCLV